MTIRYCRVCGPNPRLTIDQKFHALDNWPEACHGHFAPKGASIQVIRDIDPYKTVAADVDGKQVHIGGRRQHREFLQRNNYVELGNDVPSIPRPQQIDTVKGHEIKAVIEQLQARRR